MLFPGPVATGMAAARDLQLKMLAEDAGQHFDEHIFGEAHLESVSAPFLVRCRGGGGGPALLLSPQPT